MSRIRLLFIFIVILALAAALAACGGDDGLSADSDPQEVLDQTFSADNEAVESGDLSFNINLVATGDEPGTLDAALSGPFDTRGDEDEVAKFDLSASYDVRSTEDDVNFDGGLISTGDSAFVNYKGTDYEVDQAVFEQFVQLAERTARQQEDQGSDESNQALLNAFGIEDPSSLLTNLSNEGTTDVEGTETVHVSGDLAVDRSIEALKNALGSASALGALGAGSQNIPEPEELDEVAEAIRTASFDLFVGTDDNLLRRAQFAIVIEPPDDPGKLDLSIDFTIAGLNEEQTIEAPSGAQPFTAFLSAVGADQGALGALGALGGGGLGGGSLGGGSDAAPTTPTTPALPGSGPDADAEQAYIQCLSEATSAADVQDCEELVPAP